MPTLINSGIDFDRVERATLLAALYHWRDSGDRPDELEYVAREFGEFAALDDEGINQLIDRINGGEMGQ